MARIRIEIPGSFSFQCIIPVRITDINYGGHVGNDAVLSLIHEARMQFFHSMGYTEMNLAGSGMIMADAAVEFKSELFYGDTVFASVSAAASGNFSFDLFYKLEKEKDGKRITAVLAKTGMICFDYEKKKIISIPEAARANLFSA